MQGNQIPTKFNQTKNANRIKFESQTVSAKVHRRNGNSQDCLLRSQKNSK